MSYKTDRLVELFPDAYAAQDQGSLLYRLLDAIGFELMQADAAVKWLLKSHWVNYAEGHALDALASIYGVERRRLRDGHLESDAAFRLRLKSIVTLFTGGGTVRAVKGAVQSALGLPYNLDQLNVPEEFAGLKADIDSLVRLEEFPPEEAPTLVRSDRPSPVEIEESDLPAPNAPRTYSEVIVQIEADSTQQVIPEMRWSFTQGGGRYLSLERLNEAGESINLGICSKANLVIPEGKTLSLSRTLDGDLTILLDGIDIAANFTNLDGSSPPQLPDIPRSQSRWRFRSAGGVFDSSTFDRGDSFGLPEYQVEIEWVRRQPMSFIVHVPYFLQEAVKQLQQKYQYPNDIFVFEGLPLEKIQSVVNQTQAAGVKGKIQFFINFVEIHTQNEHFKVDGTYRYSEDAQMQEDFQIGSFNRGSERHDVAEKFVVGAVFNVSTFDTSFGFQ